MIGTVRLFVYGTLRPPVLDAALGDSYNYPRIAPYVLEACPAWVEGARLYDLGPYPVAYPGDGRLYGDLLLLSSQALALTDRVEGHPHLYRRERLLVHWGGGAVEAWIYWGTEALGAAGRLIPGGDWFRRMGDAGER